MPRLTNYSLVVLSKYEQSLFERFRDSNSVVLTKDEFLVLRKKGLVEGAIDGKSDWFDDIPESGICKISGFGKGLRAYQSIERQKALKEDRRYWITTIIAILALILALTSLMWQYEDRGKVPQQSSPVSQYTEATTTAADFFPSNSRLYESP